jgi:hypothetical protein
MKCQDDAKLIRIFKAQENQTQWAIYTLPFYTVLGVYGSAVPSIGGVEIGSKIPWVGLGLALGYAYFNDQYFVG